jgi:hypothetical protein
MVNVIRREFYGKALTKYEIEAGNLELPVVKTGPISRFLESDSPTEYARKMDNIMDITQRAINRLDYAIRNGSVLGYDTDDVLFLDENGAPLSLYDTRFGPQQPEGKEPIEQQAIRLKTAILQANPNLSREQVTQEVKRQLGR